jgi:hypothetical protein
LQVQDLDVGEVLLEISIGSLKGLEVDVGESEFGDAMASESDCRGLTNACTPLDM